jgi:GntR family transcriptional regulator/MocR family aminotransferase
MSRSKLIWSTNQIHFGDIVCTTFMAKRVTAFDLMLPDRAPDAPAYRWVYGALRAEILDGRLRPGARLPSTRDLAAQYRLSRGTIVTAFEQLKSEGYIDGNIGSGSYVSKILPDQLLEIGGPPKVKLPTGRKPAPPRDAVRSAERNLSEYARRLQIFPPLEPRPSRAFRAYIPALDLFPTTVWTRITARRSRTVTPGLLLGCDPLGYRPLREIIADYLQTSRGVRCSFEQVAIVSGVQEALDLTARLFLDPGDRVCMENPGYIGASCVFEAIGAEVIPTPLDDEGIRVDERAWQGSRLVYVTPGHQFPLGITMSLARRLHLLKWAESSGALIFEDDYDSEYRYSGRPVPALQGLDRTGCVLYAGTFSKTLFPSLRLGYLVAPRDLAPLVQTAKSVTNRHAQLLDQAVLCDFISEGHFGRHLRRMREVYSERLSVLLESARQRLDGLLEVSNIEAGLQTVGWLPSTIDDEAAAKRAAARQLEVVPLSWYDRGRPKRQGLQLGFAATSPSEIRRGVRDLASALEEIVLPKRRRASTAPGTVASTGDAGSRK